MSKTPTQNETHAVCDERLAREGGNARCCECEPHENCMHMRILMEKDQMRSKLLERLDFLSDHWTKGDDRPPFNFGGWREEVADDFVEIYKNYLANARKEGYEEGYAEGGLEGVKQGRADARKEVIEKAEEMIDEETEYPSRIWSKSLESVELSIAVDGLETYKRELKERLATLRLDNQRQSHLDRP